MTSRLDPYAILGVPKDASPDQINSAYQALSRRLNPEQNPQSPGAAIQYQEVIDARDLLIDPAQRNGLKSEQTPLAFAIRATPSKRVIQSLPEPQVIYLLLDIIPNAKMKGDGLSGGINLALVLDHSKSMQGVRLDKVKAAAAEIIQQLTPQDTISVVGFNDRAEVILPATRVQETRALISRLSMMRAAGGTEIYQGLAGGATELSKNLAKSRVNHIILLTDGRTFGDEEKSLKLAQSLTEQGVTISALGLGHEWNDVFLDNLASITGGSSEFIKTPRTVVKFMNDQVRSLTRIFARNMRMSVANEPDIDLELLFKLAPSPQPLSNAEAVINLGGLQIDRATSVLLQMQIPANIPLGFRPIARISVTGEVMANKNAPVAISDLSLEVAPQVEQQDPPEAILDALGKLTLYRMQERANEALENGDVVEATQRLKNFATRLLDIGESELANQAMSEVRRLEETSQVSEEGRKSLKYQTRHLMGPGTVKLED